MTIRISINCFADWHENGIVRFCDVMSSHLPACVKSFDINIISQKSIKGFRCECGPGGVSAFVPDNFNACLLFGAVASTALGFLRGARDAIVECNREFMMPLAEEIRHGIAGSKLIAVMHSNPGMSEKEQLIGHYMPQFASRPNAAAYRRADHIVCVCGAQMEYLRKAGCETPATLICNGVPRPRSIARHSNGGPFRFIFTSGYVAFKGFGKIIAAIRKVAQMRNIQVVVVGGGAGDPKPDTGDLPVVFTGFIASCKEVARLCAESDCALFASVAEACSFATIEAMSAGLPIISTDVVGQREMLEGGCALLVKMNPDLTIDADEYAAAMLRVIDEPMLRMRLSAAAFARYMARYTAKKTIRGHLDLYRRLLKHHL
ncbi:MAG: glycosyltransferase family 4 protein [Rickettsiales bacterium]|nr:glycosyltransferase family 4 protein [Rickettsiales bacterium]